MNHENQNIEYKETWRDEYLKWICGFANAQGGILYIGINDDGKVIGVTDAQRLSEDIPNKVRDMLGIIVDVNLQQSKGKTYIAILVKPSNVPISYKGQYHYRSGSTKQELKGVALHDFLLQKNGKQWDDLYSDEATVNDIDSEAVKYFLAAGIDSGRVPFSSRHDSLSQVLKDLHLLSDNGQLKNAALLLFAKDPLKFFTGVRFRIGRMGHSETDLIAQDIITGNILQMADAVVELLKTKYLFSYYRYERMRRTESLEIPELALRELLYNALIHKDYRSVDIQMQVFDDRIVLWNPGELPESFTVETLLMPHKSVARNQNIADAFFRAGFVETWGQGIGKVCEAMKNAQLEIPTFTNMCGGLEVTIKRKCSTDIGMKNAKIGMKTDIIGMKNAKIGMKTDMIDSEISMKTEGVDELNTQIDSKNDLQNSQKNMLKQILQSILTNKNMTVSALAHNLGKSRSTIQIYMRYLVDNGYILRVGPDKGGHWEVINKQ